MELSVEQWAELIRHSGLAADEIVDEEGRANESLMAVVANGVTIVPIAPPRATDWKHWMLVFENADQGLFLEQNWKDIVREMRKQENATPE